jgi:hypothetical protein
MADKWCRGLLNILEYCYFHSDCVT